MHPFFGYNSDFIAYGMQHNTVLIVLACCIGLGPILAKTYLTQTQNLWISRLIAIIIAFWVVLYDVVLLYLGNFNYKTDLPLDICNLMGLLLPFFMWNPSKSVFRLLYFWILCGTTQAVLAPHLYNGFPNFIFIKYWIVHAGLIIYILFVAVVWAYSLSWKDLFRAFIGLQFYAVLMYLINTLIGSNYMYVVAKPPTASMLDYFGPWPYYLMVAEVLFFFFCIVVFIPHKMIHRKFATSKLK